MNEVILGIHHPAITVSDYERSLVFYRDVLGFAVVLEGESSGPAVDTASGMQGVQRRWVFLRAGDDLLELIHYLNPPGKPYDSALNDVGTMHVAFKVADIEEAYRRLSARGVEFTYPPRHFTSGATAGYASVNFLDPDGVVLELFQDR